MVEVNYSVAVKFPSNFQKVCTAPLFGTSSELNFRGPKIGDVGVHGGDDLRRDTAEESDAITPLKFDGNFRL